MSNEVKQHYIDLFSAEGGLANIRKEGLSRFEETDIPTRATEDWKYTSVAKLLATPYSLTTESEVDASVINNMKFAGLDTIDLVFINGQFKPEYSDLSELPDGLVIEKLATAYSSYQKDIDSLFALKSTTEKNLFIHLNQAFADNSFYIHVGKNVTIEKTLHIKRIYTDQGQAFIDNSGFLITSETGSNFKIIEEFYGSDDSEYFTNVSNKFQVDSNAQLTHYKIQRTGRSTFQVNNTVVTQERDSTFTSHVVDLGGSIVRNNLSTTLLNSGTETNYYGVYLGDLNQHIDNQTFIDHAVPHCNSNEMYKGVLNDKARGVFNGKVIVRPDAQKTNAFQQNSSLVLAPTAVMDAKPQLEIFADDVKCSHGATIGQLDEASIFYLKSRGITRDKAENLLQKAFVGEVIMNMDLLPVRDAVLDMIDQKLDN